MAAAPLPPPPPPPQPLPVPVPVGGGAYVRPEEAAAGYAAYPRGRRSLFRRR